MALEYSSLIGLPFLSSFWRLNTQCCFIHGASMSILVSLFEVVGRQLTVHPGVCFATSFANCLPPLLLSNLTCCTPLVCIAPFIIGPVTSMFSVVNIHEYM